mgnify:CR=1 FL=1
MAVSEIYIDHTGGSDSGAGTIGDPYQTLSKAFSVATTTTANYRFNVKNTSSGNPMTSLGSLPTGHSISSQIVIAPYSSSAADTESLLYLDASGTDKVWDQNSVDSIVFNRCYFQNTSTDSGIFMDLDNNILFYRSVFDNCVPQADNTTGAYYCTWKNMVASGGVSFFKTSSTGFMHGCLITGSGESNLAFLVQCVSISNSMFYWDGTVDLFWRGIGAAGRCVNNVFLYSDSTHSAGDGNGVMIDDQIICEYNVFQNCNLAIDDENNSEVIMNGPNAFYGNTTKRFTVDSNMIDLMTPMVPADYDLTSSPYPNASSGDWTMSDELRNLRTNQYTPFTGTSTAIEAYYGAYVKTADGSGGTTGRQGLHAIESGAV